MVGRLVATLAAVSSLVLVDVAVAQSTPIEEESWSKVKSVDAEAGTITLQGNAAPLRVDKSTRFTRKGKEISIKDVKPGDQVRPAYLSGKDEGPIVRVDVKGKNKAKAKAAQDSAAAAGTGSSNAK